MSDPRLTSAAVAALVVDSVGDGVIVLDQEGVVQLLNPAAEELIGTSRRQAVGKPFRQVCQSEAALIELVAKTAATGMRISDHEHLVLKKLGPPVPVSVTTTPLLTDTGEQVGTVVILRDLTTIHDLERAVRQADRLATLGTLAAGLAHEIKNPLGGIKGAAQLLARELPADSDLHEYTRVMEKEVSRVNRLLEELLELAAPRPLSVAPVNLHRVLNDILLLQQQETRQRRITVSQQFDPSIPALMGDESLLTQLFLNLVKNALEAVPDGGSVRLISRILGNYSMTQQGVRPARMVEVEVADNGPGIPVEQQEHLFTPFFTTKAQGTGLGLAICHKIAAEHRGMIRVESTPGAGTSFIVTLPLVH